jgi:hypothetical protein
MNTQITPILHIIFSTFLNSYIVTYLVHNISVILLYGMRTMKLSDLFLLLFFCFFVFVFCFCFKEAGKYGEIPNKD